MCGGGEMTGKWREEHEKEFICLRRGGSCQSFPSHVLQRSPCMSLPLCPFLLNGQDSVTQDHHHQIAVSVLLSSQIYKASGLQESSGTCDCANTESWPVSFGSNITFRTARHFRCSFQRRPNQGCVGWFGFLQ